MPFLVTPGQLSRRAELFHQLAQLTAAGVNLTGTVGIIRRGIRGREARQFSDRFRETVEQGGTATEALQASIPWLTAFEVAIIEAGEKSGRLDVTFQRLATHYSDRARLTRQMLADLAYPAFLYHFAVLILPFPALFQGGGPALASYSTTVLVGLMPPGLLWIYSITLVIVWTLQHQQVPALRTFLERVIRVIPVAAGARRALALARLSAALEALISAGVTMIEAWELAVRASGSPALERTVLAWRPRLLAGRTPAEEVSASAEFPETFANLYATGEMTGKLDETLERLHHYYQDEGTRKLQAVCKLAAWLIYFIVIAVVVTKIFQFYVGRFNAIGNAGEF